MATNDDITLAKGNLSITLFTTIPTENWKNIFTVVPGFTAVDKQDNAPNKSKVVDFQRTVRTWVFECVITATASKSAKEVKDDLRTLFEGARTKGGPIVLTYEDDSYNVYFEDCVLKGVRNDDALLTYSGKDAAEYLVTITLLEGEEV